MPPKKRGAVKATSTSARRANVSTTRLPIATSSDEPQPARPTTSSTDAKEAALLFWVSSALRRFAQSTAPVAVAQTSLSPSHPASPECAVVTAEVVSEEKADAGREPQAAEPTTPLVTDAGPASAPLKDVLPIFDALVEGQLGDVTLDVWLIGQVSLMHHPDEFARVLEAHEQAASGAQRGLFNSVTPYFLVRGASFYTLDTTVHSALPLLARLLQSAKVRKIVLHPPLLYRLLFLFLGTDRVDIANLVDLGTWLTTARQGSAVLASNAGLNALGYDISSGTLAIDALRKALPHEAQQLLDVATDNVRRALAARPGTTQSAASGGGATDALSSIGEVDVVTSSSSSVSSHVSDADSESGHEAKEHGDEASDKEASSEATLDDTDDEGNAVDMLAQLEPCAPGDGQRSRRSRRRRRDGIFAHAPVGAADVSRTLQAFTAVSSVYRFYEMALAPEVPGVAALSGRRLSSSARPMEVAADAVTGIDGTPLVDLCARRTYAVFQCALMTYHGIFVSRERFEAMMSDLDEQLRDLAQCAAMVLESRSPAVSSSSSESPAEPTGLLLALSAQEMLEYVLTQLVDEAQRAAVEAAVLGARGQSGSSTRLATHHMVSCAEALDSLVTHAPQPDTTGGHAQDEEAHEGQLASPTPVGLRPDAAHAALVRCRELVRLWLAVDERRAFKRLLSSQWSAHNARLQVRVLPQLTSSAETAAPLALATAEASAAAGEALPISSLSYSVHPRWEVHLATTGRLFASQPNVQTIAKQSPAAVYTVPSQHTPDEAQASSATASPAHSDGARTCPMLRQHPQWTLRHLYMAPPGCTLVSLDFSQIELRVLAHLSQDPTLTAQFTQNADVLAQIAQTVLQMPDTASVQPWQRQAVKVIVYGLLYGMGPDLMNVRLTQLTQTAQSATEPTVGGESSPAATTRTLRSTEWIEAFYASYPLVRNYLLQVRATALHHRTVVTLGGLKHLTGAAHQDPNQRRQAAVAWAIQGSAAELLHEAMRLIHRQRHQLIPFLPAAPVALVAAAHDELVYAVPSAAVHAVLPQLQTIMEHDVAKAVHLRVPLRVTARVGPSLGELEKTAD